MNKALRTAACTAASLAALCFSGAASAAWTFTDSAGGARIDGSYPAFTLTGSDNGQMLDDLAQYTQAFTSAQDVAFHWRYATEDCCGAYWDPAGYVLDGVLHELSVEGPIGEPGAPSAGVATVHVDAGDTFGWYVFSRDSTLGPGILEVSVGVVPEPANVALLLAGLGAIGFAAWRRAKG